MTSDPGYPMQYPNMYPNQQQYQYSTAAPQHPNGQQQASTATQSSAQTAPTTYPPQQQQPPARGQYQAYPYPPPPAPPTSAPPTQAYQAYPPPTYGYPPPAPGYYYPPAAGYPTGYPQYQSTYQGPAYSAQQSNPPPHYTPYSSYGYQTNGYSNYPYYQSPLQRTSGKEKTPPQKRQRLDPKQPHTNGSHARQRSRSITKEKSSVFSDFRVSRIKVGSFSVEEMRSESDHRDSKLRFYFRSPPTALQTTSNHQPPDVATQFPDRLSVSLHKGTRRIVLPAAHLTSIIFNRQEGYVKVEGDGTATFEEMISEEGEDATDKNGHASPKFGPSPNDPTTGEWERCKVMEIWLNTAHPLTEPKWTRGDIKKHIDLSSEFQKILHIVDSEPLELPVEPMPQIHRPSTFDEMIESWRERSTVATVEVKNVLITELSSPQKLAELIGRAVHMICPPLTSVVERLMGLIKDKEAILDELKDIILLIPPQGIWSALDSMMLEEVEQTREGSTSAVSSNAHPVKREREDDEMEITTSSRAESIHNHSDVGAAAVNPSAPPAKEEELLGDGDFEFNEGMVTELHLPETDQDETFTELAP